MATIPPPRSSVKGGGPYREVDPSSQRWKNYNLSFVLSFALNLHKTKNGKNCIVLHEIKGMRNHKIKQVDVVLGPHVVLRPRWAPLVGFSEGLNRS